MAQAIAKAKELAGARTVAVAAGDVGGQALALGLVDEVAMDVVPVAFGSGKRYFGPVDGQHLLEDPDVVIRGDRVLHLLYRVRREGIDGGHASAGVAAALFAQTGAATAARSPPTGS